MDKVKLIINNNETEVNVIRYFLLNALSYLIYSLNEEDGQGYVKLYVVKVERDALGQYRASTIANEEEWNNVKNTIKDIIKGSKTASIQVDDLDYNLLNGLFINENRVFKLSAQLVEMLGANKKEFASEVKPEPAPTINQVEEMLAPTFENVTANQFTPNNDVVNNFNTDTNMVKPTFEINPEPISNVAVEPSYNFTSEPSFNEPLTAEVEFTETKEEVDYQQLYEEEKRQNELLSSTISTLEQKLENIKNILN